jgi:hypothetical protein
VDAAGGRLSAEAVRAEYGNAGHIDVRPAPTWTMEAMLE